MGNSHPKQHLPEDSQNHAIDAQIKQDKQLANLELKVLLLGAGESGKSTVFKQMQIIHKDGFSDTERRGIAPLIQKHCAENFSDLYLGAKSVGCVSDDLDTECREILEIIATEGLHSKVVSRMEQVWKNPSIQEAFEKRSKFQLADSAAHFFDSLSRVAEVNYLPTNEDILCCRTRSTGVQEMLFAHEGVQFRMVDVGGQRNERRKWIHCFADVKAVIFVSAVSEYDQYLFEDESVNRMHESLRLFSEISNTKFFSDASIVLFLNKRDLFETKIQTVDMSICFPEYTGGCNSSNALQYIKTRFAAEYKMGRELFIHVTCATSTDNIQFVFQAVREAITLQNISMAGLT